MLTTSSGTLLNIRKGDKIFKQAVERLSHARVNFCIQQNARYVNLYVNQSMSIWTNVVYSYFFGIGVFLDRCYVVSDEHFSVFKFKF